MNEMTCGVEQITVVVGRGNRISLENKELVLMEGGITIKNGNIVSNLSYRWLI
jgi:hypothetical protein